MTPENERLVRITIAKMDGWSITVDEQGVRWLIDGRNRQNRYIAEKGLVAHGGGQDGKLKHVDCSEETWDWAMAMRLIPDYINHLPTILETLERLNVSWNIVSRNKHIAIQVGEIATFMPSHEIHDLSIVLSQLLAMKDPEYATYIADNPGRCVAG